LWTTGLPIKKACSGIITDMVGGGGRVVKRDAVVANGGKEGKKEGRNRKEMI
jgi:hypothetical protein